MSAADSLVNIFLVFLGVAGGLILINGLIDIGFGGLRARMGRISHYLTGRLHSRQNAKAASARLR